MHDPLPLDVIHRLRSDFGDRADAVAALLGNRRDLEIHELDHAFVDEAVFRDAVSGYLLSKISAKSVKQPDELPPTQAVGRRWWRFWTCGANAVLPHATEGWTGCPATRLDPVKRQGRESKRLTGPGRGARDAPNRQTLILSFTQSGTIGLIVWSAKDKGALLW
jgi:hypothetical protein